MALHDTPTSSLPVTGAILAGGSSTRLGQDKATLVLRDGRTMLEHVADSLVRVCGRVVVVGAAAPGHESIADVRAQCGPLGGIEALMASGIDPHGQYLICPCDVPLITPALLTRLVESSERLATVFHIEGKPPDEVEPLPARLSAETLPTVRRLLDAGRRSVWRLMKELQPTIVRITPQQARQLHNVNSIDDLRAINEL